MDIGEEAEGAKAEIGPYIPKRGFNKIIQISYSNVYAEFPTP